MGTKPKRKPKIKAGPPPKPVAPNPVGRPTAYRPEFAAEALELCERGATDYELGQHFKVTTSTIWRWATAFPEFCSSIRTGKESADTRAERTLYHRAIGYTFESEKVFQYQGEIVRAGTVEHVPPDVNALSLWLRNRRSDKWRDKQDTADINIHVSLADLVNLSYKPDLPALPAPKVIETEE